MATSVSNIAEVIHEIRCRCGDNNETWGIKYKDCGCCLEYANFRHDLVDYKSF